MPELLAPAGDWTCLVAAIDAGADAVYFGVRGFNMRAGAKNFSVQDFPRIVNYCHARNVRAYLALNIVVFERELQRVERVLGAARKASVDAVIASDLAVLAAARKVGLEIHVSTQMSVSNSAAMALLYGMGVRRYVLARECSLADIRLIKRNLNRVQGRRAPRVDIEVFAHGAMCVSMSGRCFLSQVQTGRSANRGECAQQCRREYRIVEERGGHEWTLGKDYVLSPGDLCTLPFVEKLIRAGVGALKIEGRNRGPEYVSVVTGAYRRALDFYRDNRGKRGWLNQFKELKDRLSRELSGVFHRAFSTGFYHGRPVGEWNVRPDNASNLRKCFVGTVVNFYRKPSVAEIVVQAESFVLGDELLFEGGTTGFVRQKVCSLEKEGQTVSEAKPGPSVGVRVDKPVRPGDKIYVMREK